MSTPRTRPDRNGQIRQPQAFDKVAEALFGRTRRRVLALLFGQPANSFYLRQIARETGAGLGGVQRELSQLVAAGVILRVPKGPQVHFAPNPASPVYEELRSLLAKTAGIADVIRDALQRYHERRLIDIAFIHGSVATGRQDAKSDIDLIIIGGVTLARLLPLLRNLQIRLGREINPSVYPREQFKLKYDRREHFVRRVMERPKIMLLGNENDLTELVRQPLAGRT
ncbi:MAG: nucleotidyltransferase domain-containing protein [Gemmatimonadales bacterium]